MVAPLGAVVVAVAALFVGLLVTATAPPPQAAGLVTVDSHFGDPFAVDWLPMEAQHQLPSPANRPLPMVSVAPACVGFERLDWPESNRHPTVAHCADADAIDAMTDTDVAVVRKILAGADTWYLIRFGAEPRSVSVAFPPATPAPEAPATKTSAPRPAESKTDPMSWLAGPYVAVLLPTDSGPFTVTWDAGGTSLTCRFGLRLTAANLCA